MSTSTKSSSFPWTVGLGRSVFPGLLLHDAAALYRPGLLSSGVASSGGASSDKLSFATFFFRGLASLAPIGRPRFWRCMGSKDAVGLVQISTRGGAFFAGIRDFVTHLRSVKASGS